MGEGQDAHAQERHGVVFPLIDGDRSTTATGSAVLADAARSIDGSLAEEMASASWYEAYVGYVRRLLEAELRHGGDPSEVPQAGLGSLHRRFVFARDGDEHPTDAAFDRFAEPRLHTATVRGQGDGDREVVIPYRGRELRDDLLHAQLDRWVEDGMVEPSFAEAIRLVLANPDWLDLSDLTVAILGAGAEMGPLERFSRWGATILAVDVPSPQVWDRIVAAGRRGNGRLLVPVTDPVDDTDTGAIAASAGADLITAMPEIATWLRQHDGALVVGNYVYADGADNVRVSVAVDAIVAHLADDRDDVSLAALATPTDVFAVPADVVDASRRRWERRGPLQRFLAGVTGGRMYAPNYAGTVEGADGRPHGIADCLVQQQGPNYALAKRLHRWRARLARGQGLVSSINVAPATATRSVTKNPVLAAAYRGADRFGVEVFQPETSRALMATMLVHDLRNTKSSAHPGVELGHPLDLFVDGAAHGGLWRIPFAPRSVLPIAAGLGFLRRR